MRAYNTVVNFEKKQRNRVCLERTGSYLRLITSRFYKTGVAVTTVKLYYVDILFAVVTFFRQLFFFFPKIYLGEMALQYPKTTNSNLNP